MRNYLIIFFVAFIALLVACKPKNGADEMVYLSDQNKASDEVYISFLTKQIDRYPEGDDKYLKLADIYKQNQQVDDAIELLKKGKEENPGNVNILVGLASLYLENKNLTELSKTLNSIRKEDPDNMDFLKLSAGYSLLLKDYTNAIFFANRAMLANPFDDEILYLRASAFLINMDSISALNSFEEAFNIMDSYKNFSKVFDLSIALDNYDNANKYLSIFESNHSSQPLCYEKGVYFHETGNLDTAKLILKNCQIEGSKEDRIDLELAEIYLEQRQIDSARFAINRFINLRPNEIDGYIVKARIMEKNNDFTNAMELFNTALAIDSTSRLASEGLENLERKIAYLQLVKRKENVQRQIETLKPLNAKEIN